MTKYNLAEIFKDQQCEILLVWVLVEIGRLKKEVVQMKFV